MKIRVDELGENNFTVSNGWITRFLKRFILVSRRITGSGKKLPKNAADIAGAYLSEVRDKIASNGDNLIFINSTSIHCVIYLYADFQYQFSILKGYELGQIIGFDETTFYLDMPGNYTYEQVGARRVLASTTGHEKVRVSTLVISSASGMALPMLCIIKPQFQDWLSL